MEYNFDHMHFLKRYPQFKNKNISGRYLPPEKLFAQFPADENFPIQEIGRSFLGVPIHGIRFGSGTIRILAWSQMHGNEATTTKAVLDIIQLFWEHRDDPQVKKILSSLSILFIPMLNPDGARLYTRNNANERDLNRDAKDLKEPESKILRSCYNEFKPDFCFNLHDQRTLFGAGKTGKPATLSFLTPAMDVDRELHSSRERSMQVIAAMNAVLQECIPGQVGRYDDAYNLNCTGDWFQTKGTPTILFEAGHFPGDYMREATRQYVALAIFAGFYAIANKQYNNFQVQDYQLIPENEKNFLDVVLRKARLGGTLMDVGIQYREQLAQGSILFLPVVEKLEPSLQLIGHREIDCQEGTLSSSSGPDISENDIVADILLNGKKLSI